MPSKPLIVPGTKFSCLVLSETGARFRRPIDLSNGVAIYRTVPVPVETSWTALLGTVFGERVAGSDCVLVASRRSSAPMLVGRESGELDVQAELAYDALAVACGPIGSYAYLLSGGSDGGGVSLRQVGVLRSFTYATGLLPPVWTAARLRRVIAVAASIAWARADGEGSRYLLRGVDALLGALASRGIRDRLHGHVRAIEALLQMPQDKGKGLFGQRAAILCRDANGRTAESFKELYALRSKIEHSRDPEEACLEMSDGQFKGRIERRTRLAERAALGIYRRILSDRQLLDVFGNAAETERFWGEGPLAQRKVWGLPVVASGRYSKYEAMHSTRKAVGNVG